MQQPVWLRCGRLGSPRAKRRKILQIARTISRRPSPDALQKGAVKGSTSPLKNDRKVALSRGGIFRQSRGLYCPRFRKSITLRVRVVRDFSGLLDRANPATPDSAETVAPQSGMPACDNSDGH